MLYMSTDRCYGVVGPIDEYKESANHIQTYP